MTNLQKGSVIKVELEETTELYQGEVTSSSEKRIYFWNENDSNTYIVNKQKGKLYRDLLEGGTIEQGNIKEFEKV